MDNNLETNKKPNRLINESSPYLLQHVYNPVNWFSWCREAFEKAKKEDKPIFLSIGYSTCHWCHVMAHESFENEEVAQILNQNYIAIKVDREERPDIDKIYMNICQIMTGSGGWPLTIFMTPNMEPFFAGTYFPRTSKYRRIGLIELLLKISEIWKIKRKEIIGTSKELIKILKKEQLVSRTEDLNEGIFHKAFDILSNLFDKKNGGFGDMPKFPNPQILGFLLRYWKRYKNKNALYMVEKTLKAMYLGGIYDHIGFGFHRYSIDANWRVPHFEKMIYDQALIANILIELYQATGNEHYEKIAKEIIIYIIREMHMPDGGFYSAEDADSEGIEGKFYLWTEKEIQNISEEKDAELIIKIFNIKKNGNFSNSTGKMNGVNNILYQTKSLKEISTELNIEFNKFNLWFERVRNILFNYRNKRVHPYKDDKILTDWNGLVLAMLAKAARVFNEPEYLKLSESLIRFIYVNLISKNGRLLHRYRNGKSEILGNLNDYAFMIWGLIEFFETTFNSEYLEKALNLNKILIEHFWNNIHGGFYFISDEGEKLLIRQKDIYDGAIPSGNSVSILNLLRLGKILMRPEFENMGKKY